MNFLLQFKQKNHSQAYDHDLQLQITKRLILVVIWGLISFSGNVATYAMLGFISMSALNVIKLTTIGVCMISVCVLRCNIRRTQRYFGIINFVLDLGLIWAQFQLFPYVGRSGLAAYGKLASFTFGWSVCLGCYATYYAIQNWWLKAIVPIVQMVYMLIPTAQEEKIYWPFIVTIAVQCMAIYVAFIYVAEVFQRKDFLEKRKVYENYEALMRIFDDINQGVMIVDPNYKRIYSNRTIDTMFNQSQDNPSLEDLFSQIQVKSLTPKLETFATEPIQMPHEDDSEPQNNLREYMDIISRVLFMPDAPESSVTAETLWWDPASLQPQKKTFSIKFTTSLFMDKRVIVINVTDTTDRDSLIAAQAASEYKTRLLSSVSHELRTPLNGSINFIEESLFDTTIPSTTKDKWLVPALRSNRLLLSLVNDILDFSQMHAGKLRMVFESRSVVETAKECIELVEIQAFKKKLNLLFQNNIPREREIIITDHNRLRQVMLNLLSNAVKFTFKGGVTLTLDPISVEVPWPDREGTYTLRGMKVTCRDTGIGIKEEDQKKLFHAFEKIDLGSRAPINATGAGLGLLISNNIVQRLSPDCITENKKKIIRFESKADAGTSFTFELYDHLEKRRPAQQIDLESSIPADEYGIFSEKGIEMRNIEEMSRPISFSLAYRQSSRGFLLRDSRSQGAILPINTFGSQFSIPSQQQIGCKCPKILLVDDDPFNLTALEQILGRLRISCHWAFNGKEAIEKIQTRQRTRCGASCQQYKILFLDCNMPIMDGYETTVALRQMEKRGEIDELKIIACTAFVQQSDEDKARGVGMDDFCTKPIKFEVIREKLRANGFFDR